MAVANGFGKVVTSGSVFMYDIGDTVNSYLGEPTTNMWGIESGTNVNNKSTWDMPYAYNGAITNSVYSSGTWNGNRIWEVLHTAGTSGYAGFESWRLCVSQPTAGNTIYNTTRRVAIKICILEGSITDLALHSGGGNGSHNGSNWTPIPESQVPRDCPQKTGWYQFLADGSWASNSVGHCVGLAFISYNRVRILTTEPMYYPSNKLIPFTGYQRSSTQGLLPLVSGATLDLSNVSFDSNAQMTFDGTDDYVSVTLPSSLSVYCLEMVWYNNNAIPNNDTVIGGPSTYQTPIEFNGNGQGVHLGAWTGGFANEAIHIWGPSGATANQVYAAVGYHHVLFNWNGTTYDIWVDGVNTPTQYLSGNNPATLITANSIKLGDDVNGYTFNGQIPVTRIYNRALTSAEVKQNYNKYKTRFNLS